MIEKSAALRFVLLQAMTAFILIIVMSLLALQYGLNRASRRILAFGDEPVLDLFTLIHLLVLGVLFVMLLILPRRVFRNCHGTLSTGVSLYRAFFTRNILILMASIPGLFILYYGMKFEMHLQSFYTMNIVVPLVVLAFLIARMPSQARLNLWLHRLKR